MAMRLVCLTHCHTAWPRSSWTTFPVLPAAEGRALGPAGPARAAAPGAAGLAAALPGAGMPDLGWRGSLMAMPCSRLHSRVTNLYLITTQALAQHEDFPEVWEWSQRAAYEAGAAPPSRRLRSTNCVSASCPAESRAGGSEDAKGPARRGFPRPVADVAAPDHPAP